MLVKFYGLFEVEVNYACLRLRCHDVMQFEHRERDEIFRGVGSNVNYWRFAVFFLIVPLEY